MPEGETNSFEAILFVTFSINGPANAMLELLPGLIPEHIQRAILQLDIKPPVLVSDMIQSQVVHASDADPRNDGSVTQLVFNMHAKMVAFEVSIDQTLVWRISWEEYIVLTDHSVDQPLKLWQFMMVLVQVGLLVLEDVVVVLCLEILYAVVLLLTA